ncbi:MAG: hypothetical protein IT369_07105 [Candidatus Latescibacteria bacterium]|nr:hypothetical protein [Candidatus Latescibacterota bacterium]
MATLSWFKNRHCWRINYTLTLRSRKIRRAKYAQGKPEANLLATQLVRVEQATRAGMAIQQELEEWIERGWIEEEQAGIAFTGFAESAQHKRRVHLQATQYDRLLSAYGDHTARICKGGALGRNYDKNMSQDRQVIAWLSEQWPNLADLTPEGVKTRLHEMKETYTESSVRHFLIKPHLLLDQAVSLGMIVQNPARGCACAET